MTEHHLTAFLFNYFIHSSVFIVMALVALKWQKIRFDRTGEWLLKGCFVLGALTASIQSSGFLQNITLQAIAPLNWQLASEPTPTATPTTANDALVTAQRKPASPATTKATHQHSNINNQATAATAEPNLWQASDLVPALLLIWFLGTMYLLSSRLLQQHQLRQLLADRQSIESIHLTKMLTTISQRAQLNKTIALSQSPHLASPIVLNSGEVVLPTGFCEQHNPAQIQAALAHELAHLKRLDGYWLWFSVVYEALLFFQPLNKLITQQIHQLTEHRADDLAARWTNNPKALAETLSAVAHDNYQHNPLPMVTAMTSKKSNLLSRIEHLLLNQPKQKTTPLTLMLAGFIGAAVLFTAPGISVQSAWAGNHEEGTHSRSVSIDDDGSVTKISSTHSDDDGTLKLKANIKGKLQFNDDETDLIAFPANSKFDLRYDRHGQDRRLVIKSQAGKPVYTYYEDGDEMPYDAAAREWFASIIPELLRTTGIDAEARVVRIRNKHGDAAVLDEVELIDSDWVSKRYLGKLFTLGELAADDLSRAIDLTTDIGSDFEQSNVLRILIRHQNISGEDQWQQVLDASQHIGSDFEMAKTLTSFVEFLPDTQAINRSYFQAAKSIGSDFEMKKVLSEYMQSQPSSVNMIEMFEVAADIGSDFELAKLLIEVNEQLGDSNDVFAAYLDLAESIGSDFEMKKVYSHLLKYQLNESNLERLIESAQSEIGSDFELSNLLLDVLQKQNLNANLLADVKDAATSSISSRFERNKVLEVLIDHM